MHWSLDISQNISKGENTNVSSQLLQIFPQTFPASLLGKPLENVQVSLCEQTAGEQEKICVQEISAVV